MYILIAIIILFLSYLSFKNDPDAPGIIAFVFTAGVIIPCIIIGACWLHAIEEFKIMDEKIAISEEQFNRINPELVNILSNYSPHEQSIFKSISPANINAMVTLYSTKYPELKADRVFQDWATQISDLIKNIYGYRLKKVEIMKNIRFYRRLLILM